MEILKEVILKTGEILVLRRAIASDAEMIIDYCNSVAGESDNLQFGKDEFNISVEKEQQMIEAINKSNHRIMIIALINHEMIAMAMLNGGHRVRIQHNSEMSISVKKSYWSRGVGSALMEETIHFAKKNQVIRNISLGVKATNESAIHLYEKFGFEKIGVHKNYFNIDGEFTDSIMMGLYF